MVWIFRLVFACWLFSKKEYAISPAMRFVMKLLNDLCLECSTWQMFFNSSLMVSITDRFRNRILSLSSIKTFFMLFRILVIRCNPSRNRTSVSFLLIYPLFLDPALLVQKLNIMLQGLNLKLKYSFCNNLKLLQK